ncbi:TadE/TadG family type IV pilus assembly protein [Comamonadaceae bacterium PP-2]
MLRPFSLMIPDSSRSRRQLGAYALEYALVFPVFFVILYAVISYGLVFTLRLSLQHAAEEGARAALRYEATGARRLENVTLVSRNFLSSWLPSSSYIVSHQICRRDAPTVCWSGTGTPIVCTGVDIAQTCSIEVQIDYDYRSRPIAPSLPGFGLIFPDVLTGKASVLLERVSL